MNLGEGGKSVISLAGLGKLSPNMIMLGFKRDWMRDAEGTSQYLDVLMAGLDARLSIGILRVKNGFDYSKVIGSEQVIDQKKEAKDKKKKEKEAKKAAKSKDKKKGGKAEEAPKVPGPDAIRTVASLKVEDELQVQTPNRRKVSVFRGTDGNVLDRKHLAGLQMFQNKKYTGFIDVWWLYDDGGLTLLLPYILTTRKQFANCKLRVFGLANKANELDREQR